MRSSSDGAEIEADSAALHEVVSRIVAHTYDALTTPERLRFLDKLELEARRLVVPGHQLINQLAEQSDPTELGGNRDSVVGKGNWPPLVDEQTFWAAQAVLDAPGRAPGRKAVRRHPLTGVALCGKCSHTLSGSYRTDGRIVYVCKQCHGVSILAENVEPMVYEIVAGRLAKPDADDLLKAEQHDTAEAEKLRTQRVTLLAELDNIGVERADGLLTGKQAKIATDRITEKLAAIEARQQDQDRLRVLDGIPLGKPGAATAVKKLSPDRFRAVLDLLMIITVAPVGKSGKVFNPERVQVDWK